MMRCAWRRSALMGAAVAWLGPLLACGADPGAGEKAANTVMLAADSASNPTVAYHAESDRGYVAWVGVEAGRNAVFVSPLSASTETAPTPVRVNDVAGDAAPHLQAPAQVAVGPEGNVYVLWQNNTPVAGRRFPASDLRLAVSEDGGRTFRPAVTVNDDAGGPPSSHTFHDIAVSADGTVYVSWIDSRERDATGHQQLSSAAAMEAGTHDHAAMGGGSGAGSISANHNQAAVAGVDGPEIRVARSVDGGRSFDPSAVVDDAACPCCRTSLVVAADGTVYVAWRKIFPGEVRDIVVARADPGALHFSAPVRVHRDGWVFPGCPHAGPSLALGGGGELLVGWYTGQEDRQGLWYAGSVDGGRSFAPPSPVLTQEWVPPSQLRLAATDETLWAVWDDRTGETTSVRAAAGGTGDALRAVRGWGSPGSEPAIAAAGEGALIAWLDGASVRARWLRRD